jgi:hypothetical protein
MKLAWRGRFGSGELTLSQYPNGSFSYFPSVPPPNINPAEHNARVEERLNQYYQACLKHAGKDGRINVRQVVISMWGMKDGKFRDGSWDKTYKALDELVKRQKLRKRERQYYIVPVENNGPPKPFTEPEPQIDNKTEEVIQQNMSNTEVETNNNVNEDIVTLSEGGDTNENNVSKEPLVQRFVSVLQGRVINNSSPDNNQNKTDKPMNTEKKRSLLREAKQVMDATFVGGGDLASKTRMLIRDAYDRMASGNLTEAAHKLREAYDLVMAEKDYADYDDHDKAVYALDLGFFIYAFANADKRLRKIAWDIWDAKNEFRNSLYDAIGTARQVLSMVEEGVNKETAINEIVVEEELAKLREILCRYNAQEE